MPPAPLALLPSGAAQGPKPGGLESTRPTRQRTSRPAADASERDRPTHHRHVVRRVTPHRRQVRTRRGRITDRPPTNPAHLCITIRRGICQRSASICRSSSVRQMLADARQISGRCSGTRSRPHEQDQHDHTSGISAYYKPHYRTHLGIPNVPDRNKINTPTAHALTQDHHGHTSCTSRPCRLTSPDTTTPQATHSVDFLRRSGSGGPRYRHAARADTGSRYRQQVVGH
jgi:hypothetical protein